MPHPRAFVAPLSAALAAAAFALPQVSPATASEPRAETTRATTPPTPTTPTTPTTTLQCPDATVQVTTAKELTDALKRARAGTVIQLADGVYQGRFKATAKGSSSRPVWLCGGPGAVLDGGSTSTGYVLHVNKAQHWRFVGFTLRNGKKGVMTDQARNNIFDGLDIGTIGEEGIHLRDNSRSNELRGLRVHDTGLLNPQFGEGVYVGSALNHSDIENGRPDRSDDNVIRDSTIWNTAAEAFDLKEGTSRGRVLDNIIDGAGTTAVDSVLDAKGNDWLIRGNRVSNPPMDVFQIHVRWKGWGQRNVFTENWLASGDPAPVPPEPKPKR